MQLNSGRFIRLVPILLFSSVQYSLVEVNQLRVHPEIGPLVKISIALADEEMILVFYHVQVARMTLPGCVLVLAVVPVQGVSKKGYFLGFFGF